MRVVAVCRGRPGLGRVVPSLGLIQTLNAVERTDAHFLSYAVGYRYLKAIGSQVTDLGKPPGLFVDSVCEQALEVERFVVSSRPDLILVDGEFFLPATLTHVGVPIVYLANPHDLIGPPNVFRRVNRLLLEHAHGVLISSLSCDTERFVDVIPGTPCLEVPPIIKLFSRNRPSWRGAARVIVSLGGGSVTAAPTFREQTQQALAAIMRSITDLAMTGTVNEVTVVLGADGVDPLMAPFSGLTVLRDPVELTTLYADYDILVTRAGRNACAEARYAGIATVLIPITADPFRGSEQADNATIANKAENIFAVPAWHHPGALSEALAAGIAYASEHGPSSGGVRGNESAARFVTRLLDGKRIWSYNDEAV